MPETVRPGQEGLGSQPDPSPLAQPHTPQGWQAGLHLGFACQNGKTVLAERRHWGPLSVQRPFYADDGLCHVYVLHPPGGVVAGDSLELDVRLGPDSSALVTTPAAGKFYRSGGATAHTLARLSVAKGAALEWLPQETIVYNGAQLQSETQVDLHHEACFIGWDMLVFGRPAADETFANGFVQSGWRIFKGGKPFYRERVLQDGPAVAASWGLNGQAACGTLFAYPATAETLATVQNIIADLPGCGVTRIDGLLVCRALDKRGDRLRALFDAIWTAIRPGITQRQGHPPRIWAT